MLATSGEGNRLQFVDLAEQLHQGPEVRFAIVRHLGIQVVALAFPVQQHSGQPFGFQFGPDMGQRRRQAALVPQRFPRSGKEGIALRGDSPQTSPVVTRDAIISRQGLVELLPVIELQPLRSRQHLGEQLALFSIQVEPRPRSGSLAQAPTARIQVREGRPPRRTDPEIVVATGTTEPGELHATPRREVGLHRQGLECGDGLVGHREHRGRNGLPLEAGTFQLEGEGRLPPGVEIGQLDLSPAGPQLGRPLQLLDPAPVAGLLLDDLLPVQVQRSAVHLKMDRVAPRPRNLQPPFVFDGALVMHLPETLPRQSRPPVRPAPPPPDRCPAPPIPALDAGCSRAARALACPAAGSGRCARRPFPWRRRSGIRPDGRVACGRRRNSARLATLYFFSKAPRGAEVVGSNSRPVSSRGE